ncbi:MAG: hypothetical protein ABSE48_20780, partial [Verrucomicrobiota bacterium]
MNQNIISQSVRLWRPLWPAIPAVLHHCARIVISALALALLAPASSRAASTWTGDGGNNDWSTTGNWNVAPSFPTGLTFAGTTGLLNSNDLSGITVSSITFDSAAGAFVLDGNDIT